MKNKVDPWYEHLIEIFYQLYYKLDSFKEQLESTHNVDDVRRQVINELKECKKAIKSFRGNITEDLSSDAFYAMVVYADEVMIYSHYDHKVSCWEDDIMEDMFFKQHLGGERLFDKIQEVIRNYNDADFGLAVLYHLCLGLGFKGEYRGKDEQNIVQFQKELYRLIHSSDTSFPKNTNQLFPQTYAYTYHKTDVEHKIGKFYWILFFIIILVVGLLYLSIDQSEPFLEGFPDQQINVVYNIFSALWAERLLIAIFCISVLLLLLSIRFLFYIFNPLSSLAFLRLALKRLFVLLKNKIQQNIFGHFNELPNFLMLYCHRQKALNRTLKRQLFNRNSTLSELPVDPTSQRRLLHQSGIKINDSHVVETNLNEQQFCGYSLLKEGIIVDLPLERKGRISNYLLFSYLIKFIKKIHKRSKINGLVIVIPYNKIITQSIEEEEKQAFQTEMITLVKNIYKQIRFIQQKMQTNLPVYLIISDCHQLSGFHHFLQKIPNNLQGQMFGWSNPEASFQTNLEQYITEGFYQFNYRLRQILMFFFLTSHNDDSCRELMNFFQAMENLEDQLFILLKEMITHAKPINGENLLLRGIYFVGDEKTSAEKIRTCFLQSLLEDKVFAEKGYDSRYKQSMSERVTAFWQTVSGQV